MARTCTTGDGPNSDAPGCAGHILVADDSAVTRDLFRLVLSSLGYSVTTAPDGDRALAALLRERFDLAMLDFNMPGRNGAEVAEGYVAETGGRAATRFVAITSDLDGLQRSLTMPDVFDRMLPKPMDIGVIPALVAGLIPGTRPCPEGPAPAAT